MPSVAEPNGEPASCLAPHRPKLDLASAVPLHDLSTTLRRTRRPGKLDDLSAVRRGQTVIQLDGQTGAPDRDAL
jgi:hypothetical protein